VSLSNHVISAKAGIRRDRQVMRGDVVWRLSFRAERSGVEKSLGDSPLMVSLSNHPAIPAPMASSSLRRPALQRATSQPFLVIPAKAGIQSDLPVTRGVGMGGVSCRAQPTVQRAGIPSGPDPFPLDGGRPGWG